MAAKKKAPVLNEEVIETPVVEEVKKTSPVKAKVNCYNLNFRKAPDGDVIDILSEGSVVTILEDNGEWSKVKVDDRTGYVMTKFISK